MDTAAAHAIVQAHADYKDFKRRLIAIAQQESPETELLEAEPKVLAFIRDWVAPQLPDAGFHEVTLDAMGNLIARAGARGPAQSLLFLCHAMNHHPETMPDPYSGAVVDGEPYGIRRECVWGRGLAEQKSSTAAALAACALLRRARVALKGTLVLGVSTAGECGRHDSIAHMVETAGLTADAAIQCGATQNQVGLGNKGCFDFRITVKGSPSHVSMPWLGRNAIQGARKLMDILDTITIPESENHPGLGRPTLTMHAVHSEPYDVRTVPGVCRLTVDRRLLPGQDPFQKFAELAAQVPDEVDGYSVHKAMGNYQYPNEVSRDAEVVRAVAAAVQAVTGREATYFYKNGALDAGYLNSKAKIPTVMFGSGEPRFAHTDQEMVSVLMAFEAMQVYAMTALMLLA